MIAAHHDCPRTFTVPMVQRAIDVTYAGTHPVSPGQRARLRHYVRCLKNPNAGAYVHGYWARRRAQWLVRRQPPFYGPAAASWFDDSGATACGTHYTLGFANRAMQCGQQVTFIGPNGQHVTATREDYGPAAWTGRTFDLNPGLKAAIGCGGLCSVRWRLP